VAIYYLGTFPPEYGGVTIKNLNLYTALKDWISIDNVDFSEIKRKNINELLKLIRVIINPNHTFVVGVAGKKTRKKFCKLFYYINRKAMNRSIILLMGGTASNDIAEDPEYTKYVREYKKVYVETVGMQKILQAAGLKNVGYYPNGRFKPQNKIISRTVDCRNLKCVFFSLIQPQKGASIILDTAKKLPNVDFAFYGMIDEQYREEFYSKVGELSNVNYFGVFKGNSEDVYKELRKYDVLLLPTTWKAEGVPGILVEAKIAGIPVIVSNHNFNAEIVEDKYDGIVMEEITIDCLVKNIKNLLENSALLGIMSHNALESSHNYYIENYFDTVLSDLIFWRDEYEK